MTKEISFKQALSKLETITSKLEEEDVELEESIILYEKGKELIKTCNSKIEEAEKIVE